MCRGSVGVVSIVQYCWFSRSKNRLTSSPRQHIFDQSQTSFPHHRVVAFHAKVQCRCHIVDDASRSFLRPIQHNILPNLHTHTGWYTQNIFSYVKLFQYAFPIVSFLSVFHSFITSSCYPYRIFDVKQRERVTLQDVLKTKTGTLRTFLKDVSDIFLRLKTTWNRHISRRVSVDDVKRMHYGVFAT